MYYFPRVTPVESRLFGPAQGYRRFGGRLAGNCSARLLEYVHQIERQKLFQRDGAPVHYGEDTRRWLNATHRGRWTGNRMISGSKADGFFSRGAPVGARLCTPSRDCGRSCGTTSSSCDDDRCQHVKACLRECRAAHCRLPRNGWRPLRTRIITTRRSWIDHLIASAI
jgi:hypothetical protein